MERSVSCHLYIARFSYHTFSCSHTSHLCTITCVFANTYLNSHNTCHLPFLQVSGHLFSPASFVGIMLLLPFERMSHLTSSLSVLASVLCPIEIHGQAAHVSLLCCTPHGNTSFKCTWFFFFFWNQASCSVFTMIDRYLMQKKGKRRGKKQWKTMTRAPSQSVKCPFSLCTISSSCRPFILRVQRIIHTYN